MSAADYPTNYGGGDGDGDGGGSSSTMAKIGVLTLVIGIFSIAFLVFLTWAFAVIFDRYCCCLPGFQALNSDIFSQIDRGIIARKAGLWGVLPDERRDILKKLLVARPVTSDMIKEANSSESFEIAIDTAQSNRIEDKQKDGTEESEGRSEIVEMAKQNIVDDEISEKSRNDNSSKSDAGNKEQDTLEEDIEEGKKFPSTELITDEDHSTDSFSHEAKPMPVKNDIEEGEEKLKSMVELGEAESDSILTNAHKADNLQEIAAEESESSNPADDNSVDSSATSTSKAVTKEEKVKIADDTNESAHDAVVITAEDDIKEHDVACAICLNDYKEGDMILNGTSCEHIFHASCAMLWLEKHDHCPFCRKQMVTGNEFRQVAEELLSKKRIDELSRWGKQADEAEENNADNNEETGNDDDNERDEGEAITGSSQDDADDEETGNASATSNGNTDSSLAVQSE
jgi:hypothetical protein